MFDLEYDELSAYAVADVSDGDNVGYVAIGFVDVAHDSPPLETRTKERSMSVECIKDYSRGDLHGKVIYVLSGFRGHAINRLHMIAGNRPLRHLAEETLLELPQPQ